MIVTIDEIRQHLRLDPQTMDPDEFELKENNELQMHYDGAVDYISRYLEYDITTETNLSKSISNCILLIIADLFTNREAQTDKRLYSNEMVDKILHLQRRELSI